MRRTIFSAGMVLASMYVIAQGEYSGEAAEEMVESQGYWYNLPLAWIVAAGAMLALLVVLTRGGSKSQD